MSETYIDSGYKVVRRKDKLSNHLEVRKDNWSIGSKKKLKASIRHKMKRIFVGILDILDTEVENGSLSEEVLKKIRSQILNLGNDQIRNIEMELDSRYNVEALNYHITMPVVGPGSFQEKDKE